MKLKIGDYYKYIDRKSRDRGVFKCIKIKKGKASLQQESLLIIGVPLSLIYLRKVSQIFKDYKWQKN